VNKTLKYRYLFRGPLPDWEHLPECVNRAVLDYNDRPHYALRGLTPNKAHQGITFNEDEYREQLRLARENRLRINRAEPHPCVSWEEPGARTEDSSLQVVNV
jgi:hypothetical protein